MAIDIIEKEDKIKARTFEFVLMPDAWQDFQTNQTKYPCCWKTVKLDDKHILDPDLPEESGIYTLLVQPGIAEHPACSYLMYVGQTTNINRRFNDYLTTEKKTRKRPNIFRLLNIFDNKIWFCFTKVPREQLTDYEDTIMNAYIPPVNDDNRLPAEIRSIRKAF